MRKTGLVTIVLVLAGLSVTRTQPASAQQTDSQRSKKPPAKKASKVPFRPFEMRQIDSPIIIADGNSIDFQRDTGIVYSSSVIKIQVDNTQPWSLWVYGCTGATMPSGCTAHSVRLGN